MNEVGSHQMEDYFSGGGLHGALCEGDMSGPKMDDVFKRMRQRYQNAYDAGNTENTENTQSVVSDTCAIQTANITFFGVWRLVMGSISML